MIELIAKGPVRVTEDHDVDKQDGWDPIHGTVRTTRELEVTVDLEFPQGHVNLEGYAPSSPGVDYALAESIGRYVSDAVDPPSRGGGIRLVSDEWSVELAGEWFDWIQQAHRYQVERSDMSIVDCLRRFKSWEETSDRALDRAVVEADGATGLSTVEMGLMSDSDYERLSDVLNHIDGVRIPESYRPEQPV